MMMFRHSGESATLSDIAGASEQALMQALGMFAWWNSTIDDYRIPEKELSIRLNRDYVEASVSESMLLAMMKGVQSGEIDQQTWFHFLEKGEMTMPGDDYEAFAARIEEQGVRSPAGLEFTVVGGQGA